MQLSFQTVYPAIWTISTITHSWKWLANFFLEKRTLRNGSFIFVLINERKQFSESFGNRWNENISSFCAIVILVANKWQCNAIFWALISFWSLNCNALYVLHSGPKCFGLVDLAIHFCLITHKLFLLGICHLKALLCDYKPSPRSSDFRMIHRSCLYHC